MAIVVEIALVCFLMGGMIFGFARGFVRSVAKPVKFFASLFVAVTFCASVGQSVVLPILEQPIKNRIASYLSQNCENITEENIPTVIKFSASISNVDLSEYVGESGEETAEKLSGAVSAPVCSLISRIGAFLLLYLACSIAVGLLLKLIDLVFKIGPLDVLNRLLGFVFSTALSIVFAWGLCSLFNFLISTESFADLSWVKEFEGGVFYRFFHEFDPIEMLLSF